MKLLKRLAVLTVSAITALAVFATPAQSLDIEGDGENVIAMSGAFEEGDIARLAKAFRNVNKMVVEADGLHLYINSPGGSATELMTMLYMIKQWQDDYGIKITTHGHGNLASAGAVLFLMGDERIMSQEATIMFHKARFYNHKEDRELTAEEYKTIPQWAKDRLKRQNAFLLQLVKERTSLPAKFVEKEVFMNADQALKYGIATKITRLTKGEVKYEKTRKDVRKRSTGLKPTGRD